MSNYYENQLSRINKKSAYDASIKITGGNGESTNQINLNKTSIPVIIKWLKSMKNVEPVIETDVDSLFN